MLPRKPRLAVRSPPLEVQAASYLAASARWSACPELPWHRQRARWLSRRAGRSMASMTRNSWEVTNTIPHQKKKRTSNQSSSIPPSFELLFYLHCISNNCSCQA